MAKKTASRPMVEILERLEYKFEDIRTIVFLQDLILQAPVEKWPVCHSLIAFHSQGFPLDKALSYSALHHPFLINQLETQYLLQDRSKVNQVLLQAQIRIPRYAVITRDSQGYSKDQLVESVNHIIINGTTFHKPFVEKPLSAEDHNVYIYFKDGGSRRLFRKTEKWSSRLSKESQIRKSGSYIYEDYILTNGRDIKVYAVGPDYAHAEARKSPVLDGIVERDGEGHELRYQVKLTDEEKEIARKICRAFKQNICGFDLLRDGNGASWVCDVNGFSFVKNYGKYYDECAEILGKMILRQLGGQSQREAEY